MAGGERKSEPQQDICPPPGGRQELSSRTSAVWRRREGRGLLRVTQQGGRSALVPMFLLTQGCRAITVLSPLCSELRVCQALSCPQNSQCSAEAPSCRCLPGFTQQGRACLGERVAWRSRWQGLGGRSFILTSTIWPLLGGRLSPGRAGACPQGVDMAPGCSTHVASFCPGSSQPLPAITLFPAGPMLHKSRGAGSVSVP